MSARVAEEPVGDALHHQHQVFDDERVEVRTSGHQQVELAGRSMEALDDVRRHGGVVETARQLVGSVQFRRKDLRLVDECVHPGRQVGGLDHGQSGQHQGVLVEVDLVEPDADDQLDEQVDGASCRVDEVGQVSRTHLAAFTGRPRVRAPARYDTRCYFTVRSKADSLIYRTEPTTKKSVKTEKK